MILLTGCETNMPFELFTRYVRSSLIFTFAASKFDYHDSGNTNLQHTYPQERNF